MGKKRDKEEMKKKNRGRRKPCCEKEGLRRGSWSLQEDKILVDFITSNGHGTWRNLPKLAGLLRCGKSCRLRWVNYLRPGIKRDPFTADEENTIIRLHNTLGNKWSVIASHLPGRTDNDIKNFWNTSLKRRRSGKVDTNNGEKGELVEANADKSNGTLLLKDPSDGNKSEGYDDFLCLLDSGAGESFRNELHGEDRSLGSESHTSSSSGSLNRIEPVKMFNWIQTLNDDQKEQVWSCKNEPEGDVGACSDVLDSDGSDDSGDAILDLLLNFPDESGGDVGFLQGTDDN